MLASEYVAPVEPEEGATDGTTTDGAEGATDGTAPDGAASGETAQ